MSRVPDEIRRRSDAEFIARVHRIIAQGPPVALITERVRRSLASIVAALANVVLLVVRAGRGPRSVAQQTLHQPGTVQARGGLRGARRSGRFAAGLPALLRRL